MKVPDLVAAARAGDRRATARLISMLENGTAEAPEVARLVKGGDATIVGVTGSPGVGKSTLVSALIGAWREAGLRVGVLAVDPSSPFTGGAIALGHPIGASGARLALTLARQLGPGQYGAAGLCGGGGQGDAIVLKGA